MEGTLRESWKNPEIRKKILFTFLIVSILCLLTIIPIPGLSHAAATAKIEDWGSIGTVIDILSCGALTNGSIISHTQNLCCLDLNTFKMVWTRVVGDDSDVTPIVNEENGIPYVYIGTEVDNQSGLGEQTGAAYVYKFNGLTGEQIWQTSQSCYTFNGESSDNDQSGGCFGNPIMGKGKISNLVIFSFSMTSGLASGNKLVAYDKDLGTRVWEYNMNIYSYSSPVDFYDQEGHAYIIICDSIGQIHMINAEDGKRITYIQTKRNLGKQDQTSSGVCIEASPIVYEGMLVVGTTSGSIFGIAVE